jgi:pilus assembly protein Flp/PilA
MFTNSLAYLETATGLAAFSRLRGFIENRAGVTAIEYGLIAGLIAVAIIVAVTLVGTNLKLVLGAVNTKLAASAS